MRFSDLAGLTVTASCAGGCTGRSIFATLGVQLGELAAGAARRAA